MAARLLPREGIFTPDVLLSLTQSTLLNPVLTGSLLTAIKTLPREMVTRWSQTLHLDLLSPRTWKTLKYLLIIGAARQANKVLSSLVLNNWERAAWDWKKEVAVVTGGASGIGYHVAVGLAGKGITVAIVDVQGPKDALAPNMHFYPGDVTSSESLSAVATAIRSAHGNPTILINNAGIGGRGTIISEPESQIRKVFEVNTVSHFLTVKEFVPAMIAANHGHIVTIASMASFVAMGGMADYACTKASALAFHEALAQELKCIYRATKVRTSVVHPSWTRTPLTRPLEETGRFRLPMMEVQTVADAVVAQVTSGKSGQLILPPSVTGHSLVRAFPGWVQEVLRNLGTRIFMEVDLEAVRVERERK